MEFSGELLTTATLRMIAFRPQHLTKECWFALQTTRVGRVGRLSGMSRDHARPGGLKIRSLSAPKSRIKRHLATCDHHETSNEQDQYSTSRISMCFSGDRNAFSHQPTPTGQVFTCQPTSERYTVSSFEHWQAVVNAVFFVDLLLISSLDGCAFAIVSTPQGDKHF